MSNFCQRAVLLICLMTCLAYMAPANTAHAQVSGQTNSQASQKPVSSPAFPAPTSAAISPPGPQSGSASQGQSASTSPEAPPPPPACQDIVIDRTVHDPLILFNLFMREVGEIKSATADHALHLRIADCDSHFYYLEPQVLANIAVMGSRYISGRVAVRLEDVKTAPLIQASAKTSGAKSSQKPRPSRSTQKPAGGSKPAAKP